MLHLQRLILLACPALLLCSAEKVLPRAPHAATESEAFIEIRNVMLRARTHEARAPIRDPSSESPVLLGTRQLTCDVGLALCDGESLSRRPAESQPRGHTDNRPKSPKHAAPMGTTVVTTEPA